MDNKVFRFLNQNVAPSEFLHYVVRINILLNTIF